MAITLLTSPPPACLCSPWKYQVRLPVSLNLAATALDKVHVTSSQATSAFPFAGQLCQSAVVSGRKQGIEKLQQPDAISGKKEPPTPLWQAAALRLHRASDCGHSTSCGRMRCMVLFARPRNLLPLDRKVGIMPRLISVESSRKAMK